MVGEMLFDARYTAPEGAAFVEREKNTVPGMASWGGTGPADTACYQCSFWKASRYRREAGKLLPRRCRKFPRLMGGLNGPAIPPDMASCRFFEPNSAAPRLDISGDQ